MNKTNLTRTTWIPIGRSLRLLFTRKRLLGVSVLLFLATTLLTWLGYQLSINFIDSLTGHLLTDNPPSTSVLDWLKVQLFWGLKWLYLILSRIVAFYLAFLVAYTFTTPGYVLLSTLAEKLHAGERFELEEGISMKNLIYDLFEGLKIAMLGLIITPIVLLVNFIPIIGQIIGFLLYTYYSALMFVDYPSSRRRWSLGQKINWLRSHKKICFRLGLMPAIVSMVPVINVFFMAILSPLLTIHATLNFTAIELDN